MDGYFSRLSTYALAHFNREARYFWIAMMNGAPRLDIHWRWLWAWLGWAGVGRWGRVFEKL